QIGLFLERRRNEERLGESESRKSAILEAALDAVITIDEAGRVVEFNAAAERIFGYPRREVLGRDLLPLIVPPRMSAQAAESFDRYRTQRTSSLLGKRFETSARRADGTEFPVEVAMTPIQVGNPPLLTIYVSDVTARRSAQQEVQLYQKRLREVMTEMLLAEERERRRLASDLHDGLSQTIALAQIKLSGLRAALDGRLAQPLDELEALIRQTDLTARSLGSELSPPILQELGLEPAVRWLVGNIGERYGLAIEMQDDGCPKPADEATRVILFRSIRELLINAAKHARPRRVLVRLEREQDRLTAAVEDDGIGMEPRTPALRGAGLLSIRERLSHVGGSMDIESAPGRGTKIRMSAPLTNGSSKNARIEA
ncbi:MAG TPA: PAS domain-containing sensor histidine kinase, partial [Thermoanaerobaculia bacterium]